MKMKGAIVAISATGEYGLLTCDSSASSYGLPVFVPLDGQYRPTGEPARGAGEVGPLTSCGFVGELPIEGATNTGWSAEFSEACLAAGFRWGP
jgi:hypothetical protein